MILLEFSPFFYEILSRSPEGLMYGYEMPHFFRVLDHEPPP